MKIVRHLLLSAALMLPAFAQFKAEDEGGRIEIHDGEKMVFAYQHGPLKNPKGGEIFAASAFVHSLSTPSGFQLNDIQPDDHLHHLGVWWPWKLVEVRGKKHVTWEMQKKEGRHRSIKAKATLVEKDAVLIGAHNAVEISLDGSAYRQVIEEKVAMRFGRLEKSGYTLDVDIFQRPFKGEKVTIPRYRYSGFCWRGTPKWTGENSTMLTSGGHNRDNANHQEAKWCLVSGDACGGKATLLILSAAAMDGGQPERLRVWDSKMHHGNPFVNFNPVVKESFELKEENDAVTRRSYRLIMVDRQLSAEEAEGLWSEWAEASK